MANSQHLPEPLVRHLSAYCERLRVARGYTAGRLPHDSLAKAMYQERIAENALLQWQPTDPCEQQTKLAYWVAYLIASDCQPLQDEQSSLVTRLLETYSEQARRNREH